MFFCAVAGGALAAAGAAAASEVKGVEGVEGIEGLEGVDKLTLVCPFAPGGDTDRNTRILAKYLGAELGLTVEVENVMGDNGTAGMAYFDENHRHHPGMLLTFNSSALNCNELTGFSVQNYETYRTVAIFTRGSGDAIVTRSDAPFKSLKELLDAVRAQPGKIRLAMCMGDPSDVLVRTLENKDELNFALVDAGDAAMRLSALREGRVDVTFMNFATAKPYLESGELRALCTTNSESLPGFAQIPPFTSAGVEDFSTDNFYLLLGPKDMSPELEAKIGAAVERLSSENSEYREEIESFNLQKPFALSGDAAHAKLTELRDKLQTYKPYL